VRRLATALVVGLMLIAAAPTAAQNDAASLTPRPDLLLELPLQMGGFEPNASIVRGEAHLAGLDPADPNDAETIAELQRLFDETGVTVDDMTTAYALSSVDDFFAFVVAMRLEGATAGTVLPAYLPILLADLIDPVTREQAVGDKTALVITSEGTDREPVELFVYDAGDTIWMAQGPSDVVFFVFEDLD
jgi:hypothetical protein